MSGKFYAFSRVNKNLRSTLGKIFDLKSKPAKGSSPRGKAQFLDQAFATMVMELAKNALDSDRLCRHPTLSLRGVCFAMCCPRKIMV